MGYKNDNCKLEWCKNDAWGMHNFCLYHWNNTPVELRTALSAERPSRATNYKLTQIYLQALKQATEALTALHESQTMCKRCLGTGLKSGKQVTGTFCVVCNGLGTVPKLQ
jgi:DnaJ-class molecular chaperone